MGLPVKTERTVRLENMGGEPAQQVQEKILNLFIFL